MKLNRIVGLWPPFAEGFVIAPPASMDEATDTFYQRGEETDTVFVRTPSDDEVYPIYGR